MIRNLMLAVSLITFSGATAMAASKPHAVQTRKLAQETPAPAGDKTAPKETKKAKKAHKGDKAAKGDKAKPAPAAEAPAPAPAPAPAK